MKNILRNTSGRTFYDISHTIWRMYHYSDGTDFKITAPLALSISKSGHYILDSDQIMHFIPYGWIATTWQVKDDSPHISIPQSVSGA